MARRKEVVEVEDDEDDEDEDELYSPNRDYVMARLAAASVSARAAVEAIDEAMTLFVNPDEDKRGKERNELIDNALEAMGVANSALQAAEEVLPDVDMSEGEPWEDDEE